MNQAGITHLVEHLALPAEHRERVDFNGVVTSATTHFWATGPQEDAFAFVAETCDRLAALPTERLASEKRILATEAASWGPGHPHIAAVLRFGAVGHGLPGYEEVALHALDEDAVLDWASGLFTAGNVVAYASAEPPADWELRLPPGERQPAPSVAPIDYLRFPSAFTPGPPGTVGAAMLVDRSAAVVAALDAADRRLRERLRYRSATTYHVEAFYEPLARDTAHAVVWADCLEEHVDATRIGILSTFDDLAHDGPTDGELRQHVEEMERTLLDPDALEGFVFYAAHDELFGRPRWDPYRDLAERRSLTPAAAAKGLAEALDSLLLVLPEGAKLPGGRFSVYPTRSPRPVGGTRYRLRGIRSLRDPTRLVAGPEGVAYEGPDIRSAVRFEECVAMLAWADGKRGLWSKDGFYVSVDPAEWRGGRAAVATIDAGVAAELVVPADVSDAEDPELEVAIEALEAGEEARAVELLERIVERDGFNAVAWWLLAVARNGLHRHADAVDAADRALSADPNLEGAHRARGYALWYLGRRQEAIAALRRALDLEPAEVEAVSTLAWFLAESGHEADARRAASRAVELFPHEDGAWFAHGWVEQQFGRFAEAEPSLRRAIELNPDEPSWHNNLGFVLLATGRPQEALEHLERALALDADHRFARMNKAQALRLLGRVEESERELRTHFEREAHLHHEALRRAPDPAAAVELAEALRWLGRTDEVGASLQSAATATPDDARPFVYLAEHALNSGDPGSASEHLARAAALESADPRTLSSIAATAALLGDAERARWAADRAHEEEPGALRTLECAGYAAAAAGEWEEALGRFEQASQRQPLHCCFHVWRGLAASQLEDASAADDAARRTRELWPDCGCAARGRLEGRISR
jgi:Flp pilus assembly protein TadD